MGAGVVQEYPVAVVVQVYTGTGVIQWYRNSTWLQEKYYDTFVVHR